MAVLKAKPEKFVPMFLAVLDRELVTPLVVTRANDAAFVGALNDTVSMRVGGLRAVARKYEWRTRTNPIVLDDIQGGDKIAVKLDTHTVSATSLTLEQLTLDEINLTTEVLAPQALAVAEDLEADVVAALQAAPFKRTIAAPVDTDPLLIGTEARRLLNADKVAPQSNRFFLVGTDVEAAWLASGRLADYQSTGQTGTPALRDAIVGRLSGAPVIVSQSLPADFAFYGHKSALVLGNVAPVVPQGATYGRRGISRNGIAMTWIMDYDANYSRDRSIVQSFSGITSVQDERKANGDLLDPTDPNYGVNNVRGVMIDLDFGTTGGSVLPPVAP